MKSVYTSGFVLFLFLSSFVSGQNYCTPDYLNTGSNSTSIHEVNLGDLRDTAVTAHRLLQYLDYSSAVSVDTQYYLVTTELIRGKNQTLKVSSGVTGCAFSAWIDYDGNGEFDDQDEKLGIAYCPNTEGQIQFHIPAWVTPGDKRLRVSLANSTVNLGRRIDFLPCTPLDPATGQTIDYTVEIHADYCFPTLTSACDTSFMIDGFELNTTRNLNTGKDLAACHSDFTNDPALLTELIRTVSDSLKIHLKNLIAPAAFVNMWIDADDDGEYENYESPLSNLSIPVLTTLDTILSFPVFPIPNETGYKRLRVQVTNTSITNGYEDEACNPFAAGEYEDYLIYIGNSVCTPANSGAAVNGAYVNSVTMDATPASSNTGGNLHYKDYYYTPASFINLTPDKNHSLTVQTVNSTGNTVYVQAFADFNNDGFFDTESPYENLVYNFNGQKYISHQSATALDVITFRSPSVLTEGPIHLRVLVADSTEDFYCGQANPMIAGEIEDYKLIISNDDSLPPIADVIPRIGQGSYTGGAHEFCPGNVQFYDASFHHPSQWHWEFPGGQPAVSDEQNPVVFYDSAGYKTVKLIVTNVFGTDSVTLTNLIYINANAIHFRDVNGAVLGDTVITCNGSTSFYINAADNPYFQTYTWTPAGSDTSLTFNSGPLPTGNYIHLTVETRTVPSCFVKDSLYLILNSPPQIDLSITPGVSEVCAAVSFIDTLTCTNTSSILGTYQYAVHFNSGGPTTLINYGQVPTTLVDTIDLSANSGSTLTYLAYFNPGNTGNSGCSIVSDSVTYTIRSQPSATLRTLDSGLYCIGGRIKAIATRTGGAGNPAYQWISNAGTTVSQNIDTLILDDNSVSPGTISLQYSYSTSNPGCTAYTANYSETLNSRPQVSISTSVDSICNQANLAILCDPDDQTGNGNTGGTYAWSWSSDQGNVWNVLGSGLDTFFVGTLYVPGLSGTDTTVQVRVQYTGSPIELGCNSNPASRNVVIQSTPDVLNSFLNDDLCSGSTPGNPVNLVATIPGSTFQWYFSSGALVQVVPDSGNTIQINPVFTNSSLLQDTTLLYVTATGPGSAACPGITRTIAKFTVNPVPSAPVLPVADSAVCSLSRNIFLSLVAQPGIVCIWDTIPTALHSLKSMDPGNFAVFDFNSVTSVTRDSVSVHALFPFAADCPSPEVYAHFTISPSSAPSQEIAIRKQDLGNTLVCLRNDADSYQWGYDSLPDYQPHFADGQVYQSCSFGNNFDDTKFYYWVIVRQGECESKYYYGGENGQNLPYYVKAYQGMQVNSQPPELSVYPNPGSGSVTLSLKNFTGSTAHFEIYDALGKIVQQSEVRLNPPDDYQSGTDVQQFPPGIYWLRVRSSQEETVLVSFIIQ